MFTARVRKSIYALSTALIPVLIVAGVQADAAAAYIAAAVAVANTIMAFLNVPGKDES